MIIDKVLAKAIKNSRGENTIQVTVFSEKAKGIGKAPSGASTGKHEAKAFLQSVDSAVTRMNKLNLKGFEFNSFNDLKKIESKLKSFGANPIVALEFAILNCWAAEEKKPLWKLLNPKAKKMPMPLANVIGGGAHTKKNSIDIQEILLLPKTKTFRQAVKQNSRIYRQLGKKLKKHDKKFKYEKTDEKAWITYLSNIEVLNLVDKVIGKTRSKRGSDGHRKSKTFSRESKLGCDFAASEFYKDGKYNWKKEKLKLNKNEQIEFIAGLITSFNIHYVEDPVQEGDWSGFKELTNEFPKKLICGDDLTVTDPKRIRKADISAVIIKPNQIGSLIKTKQAFDEAKKKKMTPVLSHRSGETDDATIAHLAVAWGAKIVKFGVAGPERMAKLDELIKIENQIRR